MTEGLTTPQLITAAIALVAVIISLVSLTRTSVVQRQQLRLQAKQEELIDLQLESIRRQAVEPTAPPNEKADIRVTLETFGDGHRFVITNWGRVPANDVSLTLETEPGRMTPLVEGDYEEKLPIDELAAGGQVPLLAGLTFGTGTAFPAVWSWRNPDGSREERRSLLAV